MLMSLDSFLEFVLNIPTAGTGGGGETKSPTAGNSKRLLKIQAEQKTYSA